MTISEFITTAIEGGWGGNFKEKPIIEILPDKLVGFHYHDSFDGIQMSLYDIVLQPSAWQAVEKVKGWQPTCILCNREVCTKQLYHNMKLADPDQTICTSRQVEGWLYKMHRMISFIANKGTLEEYIATL